MGGTCQRLVFSYSPVGHPPSSAVPARRQLSAPLDSWQSTVCLLPVGRPCTSYLRQLDDEAGVRSPLGLFPSSTQLPYLLFETVSLWPQTCDPPVLVS